MTRKSTTCIGKTSGEALTEFSSRTEAVRGAQYAYSVYGRRMYPYACSRCRSWHIAPAERHTPSAQCSACAGRDGRPKASYESEDDARRRADILRSERGVSLRTYPCRHGSGWHLTKR